MYSVSQQCRTGLFAKLRVILCFRNKFLGNYLKIKKILNMLGVMSHHLQNCHNLVGYCIRKHFLAYGLSRWVDEWMDRMCCNWQKKSLCHSFWTKLKFVNTLRSGWVNSTSLFAWHLTKIIVSYIRWISRSSASTEANEHRHCTNVFQKKSNLWLETHVYLMNKFA